MSAGNSPSAAQQHDDPRASMQHLLLYPRLQPLYEYYRNELPNSGSAELPADMRDRLLDNIRSLASVCRIDRSGAEFWYEVFTLCYQVLVRSRVTEALEIADRFADQVPEVLASSLSLGDLLCVYDIFKHLFFMAGKDLAEYRRFDDRVVKPYGAWFRTLADPVAAGLARRKLDPGRRLRIGYLCNYPTMMAPGRPAAPLFISMILDHLAFLEHECIAYAVGEPDAAWRALLAHHGIAISALPFAGYPARGDCGFPRALEQIRGDSLDVLLTDDNVAMPAFLFEQRVAPVQVYVAMGMPFWSLENLDYMILGPNSAELCPELPAERKIFGRYGYNAALLGTADAAAIAMARVGIPPDHRVAGTFARFVRVSDEFLAAVGRILEQTGDLTVIIAGNGDPGRISSFIAQCPHRDRIRFFAHDVDIFAYGRAIDFLLDTLPVASGNICREVQYFGKPVVSLQHDAYATQLADMRDPELLCDSLDAYVGAACRLVREPEFLRARSIRAREIGANEARSGNNAVLLRALLDRATG
jgi:hypothetical protein